MALFTWSDKFIIGIKEIDQQHKQIVDLINTLSDSRGADEHDKSLHNIINDLISYTKKHLSYEENLLKEHNYPDFTSHKLEHDRLVSQAIDLQKKYILGNTNLYTDLAILLNDWLAEHILVIDKKYVPFLKSIGTGCMDRMENIKELLVGIEEIDNQHIQVCDLFNSISKANEENNEAEVMDKVPELIECWKKHFKFEEDLMAQYKYPGSDEHIKEHDDINDSILNLEKMYSKGFKEVVPHLARHLNQWIEDHIKHIDGKDKELGKYLNSKGVI